MGKLILESDPPAASIMWMMLMEQQAALAGPTVSAPVSEAAQAAAARRSAAEAKRKEERADPESGDDDLAAGSSATLTYSVRGVSSIESVADAIEADRPILVALHQNTELCDALEHTLGLEATEITDGLELRLPQEAKPDRGAPLRSSAHSSPRDRDLELPTTEDAFWTLAEDEDAKTFLALRVLNSRYHDPIAMEYVAKLGQRVPRSLGLPKTELLTLQSLVECHGLAGHLYVTTSFVCFESQRGKGIDDGDSSEEEDARVEDAESPRDAAQNERWTCPLTEVRFIKKESSTLIELGRSGGEIMLLEAFAKKIDRDEVFTAIVNAAAEFDLDLSDREGAWSAVRGLLQLPPEEPLVDEFRCHSESFASEKKKGEGRLYITPFYAGWTEGRGHARVSRVELLSSVHSVEKKGAGILIKLKDVNSLGSDQSSGQAPTAEEPEPEPEPEPVAEGDSMLTLEEASATAAAAAAAAASGNEEEIVLVGFLPRARDKAFVLLTQLVDAAKAQLQQTSGGGAPARAPALQRSSSALAGGSRDAAGSDAGEEHGRGSGDGPAAATLQGWLNMIKRGGMGLTNSTKSEARWCQLRGPLMMYSEKVGGKQIGFFHLGGAKIMCNTSQRKERTFSVKLPTRTYVLQADSQATLEQWLLALRAAAKDSVAVQNAVMRQSFSFGGGGGGSTATTDSTERGGSVSAALAAVSASGDSSSQEEGGQAQDEPAVSKFAALSGSWKKKAEAKAAERRRAAAKD